MKSPIGKRVLMLLENDPFNRDVRVKREAQALLRAGYQVTVISPGHEGQSWREDHDGILVYGFPAPPGGSGFVGYIYEYGYALLVTFVLSLIAFLHPGFDIIHSANPPDTAVFVASFYKPLGRKFVYDHHDLAPELYAIRFGGKGNGLVYKVLIWLERLSCHVADHIIATNQSHKTVEMERGRVPEKRITIVRNGPDLDQLQPTAPDPSLRQKGKALIVYVGCMAAQDGVDYLLRSLKELVCDLGRVDFSCLLVGDGQAVPGLKTLTKELQLDDYVSFTGWVDQARVASYLSAADICVAPEPSNPYNDRSTMIKITEYMAFGKPTVAFDLPEHRYTAQDAAAYAHPNDVNHFAQQIAALLDDPERCRKMGQVGRERIENELAWSYQEQHLLAAYAAVRGTAGEGGSK